MDLKYSQFSSIYREAVYVYVCKCAQLGKHYAADISHL